MAQDAPELPLLLAAWAGWHFVHRFPQGSWDGKCPVIERITLLLRCSLSDLSSLLDYEILEDRSNFSGQWVVVKSCSVQGFKLMWNRATVRTDFQAVNTGRNHTGSYNIEIFSCHPFHSHWHKSLLASVARGQPLSLPWTTSHPVTKGLTPAWGRGRAGPSSCSHCFPLLPQCWAKSIVIKSFQCPLITHHFSVFKQYYSNKFPMRWKS